MTDLRPEDVAVLADRLNDAASQAYLPVDPAVGKLIGSRDLGVLLDEAAAALRELGGQAFGSQIEVLAPKPGELVVLKLRGRISAAAAAASAEQLRAAMPDGVRAIVLSTDGHLYAGADADRVAQEALERLRTARSSSDVRSGPPTSGEEC